ncbi:MAG: hypothetical protein VW397_07220 [Candidatus Margulisiibacteriota bacterium]
MLNAIDINQLIANDDYHLAPVSFVDQYHHWLDLQKLLGCLVFDQHQAKRLGVFCLCLTSDEIGLFDTKGQKKFLFQFDLKTRFLKINRRRAQHHEINYFYHRLNQLIQMASLDLIGSAKPMATVQAEPLPPAVLTQLLSIFNLGPTVYWQDLSKVASNELKVVLSALLKDVKNTDHGPSMPPPLNALFELAEALIQSQDFSEHTAYSITNRTHVSVEKNTIYNLTIFKDYLVLSFQNQNEKSVIKIQLKERACQLNDSPLKPNAVTWVTEKFKRIMHELELGRAEMFYGSDP